MFVTLNIWCNRVLPFSPCTDKLISCRIISYFLFRMRYHSFLLSIISLVRADQVQDQKIQYATAQVINAVKASMENVSMELAVETYDQSDKNQPFQFYLDGSRNYTNDFVNRYEPLAYQSIHDMVYNPNGFYYHFDAETIHGFYQANLLLTGQQTI